MSGHSTHEKGCQDTAKTRENVTKTKMYVKQTEKYYKCTFRLVCLLLL